MPANYLSNLTKIKWQAFFAAFRIFVAIQFVYFQQNGLNFAEMGFLVGAFFLGMFLFEIPSGVFADHYGRKKSIVFSSIIFAGSFLAFGLGNSFPVFFMANFLQGMGEAFNSGSDEAIIYDSLKEINREEEFSNFFGAKWAFFMYGAGISCFVAFLVTKFSLRATFLLSIIPALISLFFALSLVEPPLTKEREPKEFFKHFKESFRFLLSHKILFWLFLFIVTVNSTIQIYFQYIQFLLSDAGLPVEYFGIIYAVFIIWAGYSSQIAHFIEKYLGKTKSLLLIIGVLFVSLASVGISLNLLTIALSIVLVEFTFGFMGPIFGKYFQKYVESSHRATVSSIRAFTLGISVVLLAPIFGRISDLIGYPKMMFFLMTVLIIVAIPSLLIFLKREISL